jgi:hypothetical protein
MEDTISTDPIWRVWVGTPEGVLADTLFRPLLDPFLGVWEGIDR